MANVVITGASRGIGLELTRQYAQAGDRVFAFCRSPAKSDKLSEAAKASGGKISVHAMDVADEKSIAAAVKDLGDIPVDILINNAGVVGGAHQGLDDMDFDAWMDAFNVMTFGPFRVTRALKNNLLKASAPKVMTITSQLAASTWPFGGMYAYSTAKAAVNKVMQILSIDWKDKVAVGLVHPGWVKTDMGGPNAQITPEESASGIRQVIAGLSAANSGKFFKWNGELHAL